MAEKRREVPLNPFSPWRSPAGSLHRTIVGRDHVIKDILDKTRRFCEGAPAKHCLLIGRRGLGKTHILALLYHYFEKNCVISGFEDISNNVLPVLLLEEERYSLNSLAIFLMRIFEKFFEKATTESKWLIPESLDTDEDVIEYCFDNLKDISASEKKKVVILCDNLEDVLRQWQDREYKKLRSFLSDQQAVMIIGTAVRMFREIVSPKQPFYEFFEVVPLVDLSVGLMLELLKKRFEEDNLESEYQSKETHLKNKMAAISKLTGGNPRLVVFLYDIVTKKNVFEIEDATNELMEGLSEYFRSRFSDLAPQEKTILDAFAGMDGPATPKEVAFKTRIKEQSTYAHIKNLKDAGFIEVVEYGKHKISRYDVTERLFRIWRQTATISGKRKFQIYIKFLKLYFTPEELKSDFQKSLKELDSAFQQNKHEKIGRYIHYLSYLQHAAEGSLKYEIFDKRTDFLLKTGDYLKAEEEILEFKKEVEIEKKDYDLKSIYKKLMLTHLEQERYEDASKDIIQLVEYPISEEKDEYLGILDKILEKLPDNDQAWFYKGKILTDSGDAEEALQYFTKAGTLNPKESRYYHGKASALENLNRLEEALEVIEKAIELDEKNASYWEEKGIIVGNSGKHEEAYQSFQKASELEPEEGEYYRLQAVALQNMNQLEEALQVIEKAIEIDNKNAIYLEEKGRILVSLGKLEESLQFFRKASKLEPEEGEYYRLQAYGLYYLDRFEEAMKMIEKAIEINKNESSYWMTKSEILAKSGKVEEGIKCFRDSMELNPEDLDHKLEFLGFLIYTIEDLEGTGEYLKEIEGAFFDKIKDNLIYLHLKTEYLILTCQFEDAISWAEKRLKKEPDDWDTKISYLINKACLGDFGDRMEGLAGKIAKENLGEFQIEEVSRFMYRVMERCLMEGDTQRAEGLFLTLLKLKEWHKINEVQESIALYLRKLVDLRDRELFINSINFAIEHISEEDLLELIKAFVYTGRYLQEGNKVIFEEVFPEVREIIFDMIKKFDEEF